jgi:hypothetical protein
MTIERDEMVDSHEREYPSHVKGACYEDGNVPSAEEIPSDNWSWMMRHYEAGKIAYYGG